MAHSVGIIDVMRSAAYAFEFDDLPASAGTEIALHLRLKVRIILPPNYPVGQ
jgi:hypothetical protein